MEELGALNFCSAYLSPALKLLALRYIPANGLLKGLLAKFREMIGE